MADTITGNIDCPNSIDCEGTTCIIIDGQALVHSTGKPAEAAFGNLGDTLADAVMHIGQSYQIIDIVFDRYRGDKSNLLQERDGTHKQNSPNKEGHRRPTYTPTPQLPCTRREQS